MWTSGVEMSCSGGGSSFARVKVFLGAGEDARARELVWLVIGISGRAGDAGLSVWGAALELVACPGASGALRKKEQVRKQKKKPRDNEKGRNLPRGNRPLLLGEGHADLLPLHCLSWVRLGLNPTFPADASAGGGRSLV
jgi:hypothetical protein